MELTRTFLTVARCTWVLGLALLMCLGTEGAPKCSQILSRIPVHKDFDIERFLGTWYTVSRTTWAWGENTFHSFSIEFKKQKDDTFQFSYTGQLGKKCLPVVSGVLTEKGRPGHYILKTGPADSNPATLIVSFTDYKDLALVYYCFKYQGRSQCQDGGMQVEVIAKRDNPSKKDVNAYIKRSAKRLCATAKDLQSTQPGLCKIPDILKAAKQQEEKKKGGGKPGSGDKCAVNNIPVQKNFDAAQLQGLWYEIARTRFTFNKMESVVNFHRHDDDKIYSYYTGTVLTADEDGNIVVPSCMTAIQGMSKTAEDASEASDRLGRVGWEDATATAWSPMKVLYADDDYTLFYACYAGASDSRCPKDAMEVTLAGRKPSISDRKRDSIYGILPRICVDPADMVETKFLENCTSWVTMNQEKIKPEDCKLDNMKLYDEYDNSLLDGTWYLYASISYNNKTSMRGTVVQRTRAGATEIIDTSVIGHIEADPSATCHQYRSKTRDMCVDTGDHIRTLVIGDGNFAFSKVIYLDNFLLVEYTCLSRSIAGTCDSNGIQFHVYTKNETLDVELAPEQLTTINDLATAVCLNPNHLQLETVWCNITDFEEAENFGVEAECDVDSITIFSDMDEYSQEGIYGYWFEVSRSQDVDNIRSTVAFFTSANNDTLIFTYTGPQTEDDVGGECADVKQETLLARCRSDSNGDYLKRFNETENFVSYVPFKVIYTDYTNVLVTYSCYSMLISGQCADGAAQLRIWSRNHTLDEATREYAYEMAFWACLNPYQDGFLQDSHHENDDCKQKLEEYVAESSLDQMESEYADDDEDDGNVDTQGDQQGKNMFDLSDINAALQMDDDEFYSDT